MDAAPATKKHFKFYSFNYFLVICYSLIKHLLINLKRMKPDVVSNNKQNNVIHYAVLKAWRRNNTVECGWGWEGAGGAGAASRGGEIKAREISITGPPAVGGAHAPYFWIRFNSFCLLSKFVQWLFCFYGQYDKNKYYTPVNGGLYI